MQCYRSAKSFILLGEGLYPAVGLWLRKGGQRLDLKKRKLFISFAYLLFNESRKSLMGIAFSTPWHHFGIGVWRC